MQATKERIVADRTFATERYILSTMPVLYLPLYRLDSGSSGGSFISSDGHGHSCTSGGTAPVWTPQGWSFPGDDEYMDCGDDTSLDTVDAITVEAWVKMTTAGRDQEIFCRDDGTNRNYEFRFAADDSCSFTFWTSNAAKTISTGTTFLVDTWYHIMATYNKEFINIYTNGSIDATPVAETGAIDNDDVSLTLGAREDGADRFLAGLIGEVRIYNRALSPLEIQHNYLATKWRYQ